MKGRFTYKANYPIKHIPQMGLPFLYLREIRNRARLKQTK